MNRTLQVAKYVVADLLSAAIAWTLFFIYRKYVVDPEVLFNLSEIFTDRKLYVGIVELGQTISITFFGVIVIFFSILLDDIIISYKSYYQSFFHPFSAAFFLYLFLPLISNFPYYS